MQREDPYDLLGIRMYFLYNMYASFFHDWAVESRWLWHATGIVWNHQPARRYQVFHENH